MAVAELSFIFLVMTPLESFLTHSYSFPLDFNIRNFSEKDSFLVFVVEFCLMFSATYFMAHLYMISLSLFILFSSYMVGEFELLAHYIAQLNLMDPEVLANQLKEITEQYLDVLRYEKFSSRKMTMES